MLLKQFYISSRSKTLEQRNSLILKQNPKQLFRVILNYSGRKLQTA